MRKHTLFAAASCLGVIGLAIIGQGCGGSDSASTTAPQRSARYADHCVEEQSSDKCVDLTIVNNLSRSVVLRVEDIDNFDWNAPRPDHAPPEGFANLTVDSGTQVTKTLGYNKPGTASVAHLRIRFLIGEPESPVSMRLQAKHGKGGLEYGWGSTDKKSGVCSERTHVFTAQKVQLRAWCTGGLYAPDRVDQSKRFVPRGSGTLVIEPIPAS